jgi:DNA-binding transcriptional LysR family regulator
MSASHHLYRKRLSLMPQPNWDHVRVFLAVARLGQFLAAARGLSLDHATVARRIAALEGSLQVRLLSRSTLGVTLTPEGEQFLPVAEAMESLWLDAQATLSQAESTISGTVRIAAPDGFAAFFLAPRLDRLAERHPGLTVQLVPLQRAFSLSKREADLAVLIDRPDDGRLTLRKLTEYSLGFHAAPSYLTRHGMPETPDDLRRHVLVTSVPDLHYAAALNYFPSAFDAGQRRIELSNVAAQMEAVRAGAGIGILHVYAVRTDQSLQRVLPDLTIRRTYHLVAHEDTRRIARVDAAHRFVVEMVEEAARLFD